MSKSRRLTSTFFPIISLLPTIWSLTAKKNINEKNPFPVFIRCLHKPGYFPQAGDTLTPTTEAGCRENYSNRHQYKTTKSIYVINYSWGAARVVELIFVLSSSHAFAMLTSVKHYNWLFVRKSISKTSFWYHFWHVWPYLAWLVDPDRKKWGKMLQMRVR